jgi:hemerythrin
MEATNYPGMAKHKSERKEFAKEVLTEVKNFEEGQAFVPNKFVNYPKEWILSHIAIEDKQLAYHVHDMAKKAFSGCIPD